MNLYPCWYEGTYGYCFRHPNSGWWFIADDAHSSPDVHRYLRLTDLVFACPFDWQQERRNELGKRGTRWWRKVCSEHSD